MDFIKWIIPFINEGGKKLEVIGFDNAGKYDCFTKAIEKYRWPLNRNGLGFNETLELFKTWRNKLTDKDQHHLLKTCKEIFGWGGILKTESIEEIGDLNYFLKHMNQKLSQDEIIIYDLNPNYISSGFTKIYAALNENFVMYDGRVGAALCYFIRKYLEGKGEHKLPLELMFGWGLGRSEKNRNPSSETLRFKEITANRTIHFISNIKASWLLETIAKDKAIVIPIAKNPAEKVFALQTALFVLGEELPI